MRGPALAGGVLLLLLPAPAATPEPPQTTAVTRVEPCRLVDTRGPTAAKPDPLPAYGPPELRPGVARSFVVAGQCGVPAGASAVLLEVVVTHTEGRGYLVAYPSDAVGPASWSLDYDRARQTVTKLALVGLGSGGFDLIARGNGTHLVIDVVGYYGGDVLAD